jgi:DNA-binding SARP family transcriptional activator
MARLELQLLGFPQVRLDGRGIGLTLRKGLAILAYLGDAKGPVSRDVVADLLWPDADPEAARARLRRNLHKLRLTFGVEVIEADRRTCAPDRQQREAGACRSAAPAPPAPAPRAAMRLPPRRAAI